MQGGEGGCIALARVVSVEAVLETCCGWIDNAFIFPLFCGVAVA